VTLDVPRDERLGVGQVSITVDGSAPAPGLSECRLEPSMDSSFASAVCSVRGVRSAASMPGPPVSRRILRSGPSPSESVPQDSKADGPPKRHLGVHRDGTSMHKASLMELVERRIVE
jgi:hypothetical protein